jgi:nicotinate-nucleotide adenylyltransferase
MTFARARIPETKASLLPTLPPPAWVYLHGVKSDLSSTRLRQERERDDG